MYMSRRIAGPITFGLRRPVIVFPPGVAELDSSVQHAIACHELLHVRRRDWAFQFVEEGIRTVLWFHPAIWWLIGRVQLTREQVVDQEAVRLIESRERYVEALLAVAIGKSPGFLTPAPAFFRRSLLKKRVAQILQESTMTTRRLLFAGLSAAVLALAATMAIRLFPLEAQGNHAPKGTEPVEIVKGGEHLLHGELPEYPRRAIDQKVEGDVLLDSPWTIAGKYPTRGSLRPGRVEEGGVGSRAQLALFAVSPPIGLHPGDPALYAGGSEHRISRGSLTWLR